MMSFLKRRWREFVLGLINALFSGTHMFSIKRCLLNSCADITVGKNSKVVGPIKLGNCSQIRIGENCWIGMSMTVCGDGCVTIGDNCDLAPEVTFITGSHELGSCERRAGAGKQFSITVGKGCWLGAKCAVTNSVSIGDGAVVGACALVNKQVDANTIVAGVPARKIKELE